MTGTLANCLNTDRAHVSRMLDHALTLGTEEVWWQFAAVSYARLPVRERATLVWACLMSLDPDQIEMVCGAAMIGAGTPQAALMSDIEQACFWSDMATEREKMAYALASYNALSRQNQLAFLDHVTGRAAA